MPLVDQVANSDTFPQRQTMLFCEGQHVLYSLAALVTSAGVAVSGEGLKSADHDLFGRVIAARSELLLDQVLATRIEMNVDTDPGSSTSAGYTPQ